MKTMLLICALTLGSLAGKATAMVNSITATGIVAGSGGAGYLAYRFFTSLFDVNKILYSAGYEAAVLGIHQAPASEQGTIARDTVRVTGVVLAWLPNNADQNAQAVNGFIIANFSTVPWLLQAVQAIAPTVERYIPVSTQFLSPQVIQYITSLLTGIRDGAGTLLDNPAAHVKAKYTTVEQREHENKKINKARAKLAEKRGVVMLDDGPGWFQTERVGARAGRRSSHLRGDDKIERGRSNALCSFGRSWRIQSRRSMLQTGYLDWHEWARVQDKANGFRQVRCGRCGLCGNIRKSFIKLFPRRFKAQKSNGQGVEEIRSRICNQCLKK